MAEKDFVVKNGLVVNTNLIVANGDSNRVGINNASPDATLTVTGTANVSGNVSFKQTTTTVDTVVSNNLTVTNLLYVDVSTGKIGIKNTSPDADLTLTGSANVSGNLNVLGNLIVVGNTVSQGTQEYTGALTPSSNGISLGNATNRWSLSASNGDFSGNVLVSGVVSIGNSTANIVANSTSFRLGNGSVNVSINSTAFSGTANNSTNLGGQPSSYYVNATNISTGTLASGRLPTGNATNIGGLQIVDSVTNTSITITATANNVKTAYDVGIAANTRAFSAQTVAASALSAALDANTRAFSAQTAATDAFTNAAALASAAYTNATTFSANASNLGNGTVPSARVSGNYTGINAVGTLVGLAVSGNSNFDSGVLFVDGTNNRVGVNTTSPSISFQIAANDAMFVPFGNTSQRPSGANGMFRYNIETASFEGYANGAWGNIAGGVSGGGYYKGNNGAIGSTTNKENLYRINSNTQSNNVTISAGENALTAGPMTISSGFNLTIETGGRVVIV